MASIVSWRRVQAIILDPRKEEPDAISPQDASAGWVTWASGLFCYCRARVSPGARVASHYSLRQSLNKLFTADGCAQEGLLRGGKLSDRPGQNQYHGNYPSSDRGPRGLCHDLYRKHHGSDARDTVGGGGFLRSETDGFSGGCKRNHLGARP